MVKETPLETSRSMLGGGVYPVLFVNPEEVMAERDHVVASYIPNFLKPEMLHIYRQVTGFTQFRPEIITRKRENAERFWFPEKQIQFHDKVNTRFFRRFYYRNLKKAPWMIYQSEVIRFLYQLQNVNADVLHIYFGHVAIHLLPLIKACPKPVVVSFHGADVGVDVDKEAHRKPLLEVLESADLVFGRSQSLLEGLKKLGCPADKLRLQRTGIHVRKTELRDRNLQNIGTPEEPWRFLQACRLIEKKGLQTSLKTLVRIAEKHSNIEFTIAGDGPLREALERESASLPFKVNFPGFLSPEQLLEAFYQSHFFIHPSEMGMDGNQEGVPNAMLEAMATGMPALSTRHGGIPEVLIDQKSGVLVEEKDAEALAAGTLRIMENPERYFEIARTARHHVEMTFEHEEQIKKLEGYYFEAMEMRKR